MENVKHSHSYFNGAHIIDVYQWMSGGLLWRQYLEMGGSNIYFDASANLMPVMGTCVVYVSLETVAREWNYQILPLNIKRTFHYQHSKKIIKYYLVKTILTLRDTARHPTPSPTILRSSKSKSISFPIKPNRRGWKTVHITA